MMKPKTKAELAREPQDQQKVLEFLREGAESGEHGQYLVVQQFKYYFENIRLDKDGERNAWLIEDALGELDRAGKIELLAFIDGTGQYENVVVRLPQ